MSELLGVNQIKVICDAATTIARALSIAEDEIFSALKDNGNISEEECFALKLEVSSRSDVLDIPAFLRRGTD